MTRMHEPLHPGEIVRDALFEETDLTVGQAAEYLKVDRTTLSRLLNGHSGISADMAYRLSLFLGTSADMWLNLQRDYDLWEAEKQAKKRKIKIIPLKQILRAA